MLCRLSAADDTVSVDSRSEVETLAISSDESSPEEAAAAPSEPARPPLKARPIAVHSSDRVRPPSKARPVVIPSSRAAYLPPKAPPIAPSRAAPSAPKTPRIAARVEQTVELWDPTILRIGAEIYDQQGQLIQFISIDYHQVLDRCNLSRHQSLRLTLSGQISVSWTGLQRQLKVLHCSRCPIATRKTPDKTCGELLWHCLSLSTWSFQTTGSGIAASCVFLNG